LGRFSFHASFLRINSMQRTHFRHRMRQFERDVAKHRFQEERRRLENQIALGR
jgi:hypothetical protein